MQLPKATLPCVALLSSTAQAFYLPGVAPTTYQEDSIVSLNVNHLTPAPGLSPEDHQLRSVISYDYYHPNFRFCEPEEGKKDVSESLGSILFGDRIQTSPFELKMKKNESCKAVCPTPPKYERQHGKFLNMRIKQNYNFNWLIDGLPAGVPYRDSSTNTDFTLRGFSLGQVTPQGQPALNNHYDILVDYHEPSEGKYRVVGVLVIPSSRKDSAVDGANVNCGSADPIELINQPEKKNNWMVVSEDADTPTPVAFTYGVYWRSSQTAWATRWDTYLHVFDPKIHWFSLVNSAIIVVFLCAMVVAILMRALKKDIARYNRLESFNLDDLSGAGAEAEDGVQEDSGWKLVHGDVFRTPKHPLLLSVFLGSGSQLFFMTGSTIIFALLGFLSPSNRGSLGTVMILLYTIFGFIGGYVSARVYKSFGGEAWKRNIVTTPVLVPGIVFATFFLLNLFLWAKQSSGAVPFSTMLVILGVWFAISVPLSFAGSWVGFRHAVSDVLTASLPRPLTENSRSSPQSVLIRYRGKFPQVPPTCGPYPRCYWLAFFLLVPFLSSSTSSWITCGQAKCTTCLASSSSRIRSWLSLAARSPSCSSTSSSAAKTTTGSGGRLRPLGLLLAMFLPTL